MLSAGNGEVVTCISNLMAMRRGECAYERVKGIDQDIIDETVEASILDLIEDAEFVIEQFEERVSLSDVEVLPSVYDDNTFDVKVVVSDSESKSDDDMEE